MMRRRTALLVGVGLVSAAARKPAECDHHAWQTLPPTPALPTPHRTQLINSGGAEIFVAEYGQGSPILLVHGGLANANYWGNQIPEMAKTSHVIAMDLRGHGRSTLGQQPLSYGLFAQDVRAVMDSLKLDRAAIAGWSDGGIVGLSLASSEPNRVSSLFCFGANIHQTGIRESGNRSPVFEQYVRRVAGEYRAISPTPGAFRDLRAAMRAMWKRGSDIGTSDLAKITARSRIADGAHDEIILRSETEAIARGIPGAELVILACVSHFAMLQDPPAFIAAMLAALARG